LPSLVAARRPRRPRPFEPRMTAQATASSTLDKLLRPDDDGPDDDGVDGGQATIPSYERCSDLGDRARRNFEASLATVDVPQCEVETHCQAEAFYSDRDGCWASCTVLAGSEAYSEELKTLARASCSRFFAAGCEVASAGCPAPSSDVAPLGCQDSVCATQE
jgi:hypothetical protein